MIRGPRRSSRSPASLARHGLRTQGYRAGLHVRAHPKNPEVIEINLFEAPGVQLGAELHTALVRHFSRQEFRRASHDDIGMVTQGTSVAEAYVSDLVESVDAQRIRNRGFRVGCRVCALLGSTRNSAGSWSARCRGCSIARRSVGSDRGHNPTRIRGDSRQGPTTRRGSSGRSGGRPGIRRASALPSSMSTEPSYRTGRRCY